MNPARIAVALFGPEGRGSFNESGYAGVLRARADGHAVDLHWIAPLDGSERADALRAILKPGLDLMVAHGGQGDVPVSRVAAEFPGTRFAITQGGFLASNVACYEVMQEHSAFLAGILAGMASRTRVVAHMSGEKVRPGLMGRAAFAHGVRMVAPDCRFVTRFCGNQHDAQLAYETTTALQAQGADYLFAMIDGGREGASRACRETGLRQIGNVLDWVARDPDVFAASAIADSGSCIAEAIHDYTSDRLHCGHTVVHGIGEPNYVRLVLAPELERAHGIALAHWRERLLRGEFMIKTEYTGPEF